MSKINAVRLVNVNYNNNAICINDECFEFHGESTLLSLRNGGGKSVLVQMLTAPFVHKKYRNTKDRPFESYFTTSKPSFILVEWVLEHGAGYVLTGMMVRKNQNTEEDGQTDALEIVNLIGEYQKPCVWDIYHLPIVEKNEKEIILKSFSGCQQLFEKYKKESRGKFFCYDMKNSSQARQYFDKLLEYQIHYKEWETVIKKVNLKESGLSELFADCKDEKGLVEKWLLDAVESKLDKEKNRMKEFQSILEKYVGQYKDNQSKIKRREAIRNFKEEAERIKAQAERYQITEHEEELQKNRIACFYQRLEELHACTEKEYQELLEAEESVHAELAQVEYEKLSSQVYQRKKDERFHASNREMIELEQEHLEQQAEQTQRRLFVLSCAKQQETVEENKNELDLVRQKLMVLQQEEQESEPERNRLGCCLHTYYKKELDKCKNVILEKEKMQKSAREETAILKQESSELEQKIYELVSAEGKIKGKLESYDQVEQDFAERYQEELIRNILGVYEAGTLEILKKTYEQQADEQTRIRLRKIKEKNQSQEEIHRLERETMEFRNELAAVSAERNHQEELQEEYQRELELRKTILKYLDLEEEALFDKERIMDISRRKLRDIAERKRILEREEEALEKEHQRLTQGKTLEISEELEKEISGLGIQTVYGMEWLQKNGYSEEENLELIHRHPFLPYALILSKRDVERLRNSEGASYTSFPIPIIFREDLAKKGEKQIQNVVSLEGVSFYVLFNENLLNEEKLRLLVQEKERQIQKKQEAIEIRSQEYEEYFKRQEIVENQKVTKAYYEKNIQRLRELGEREEELTRLVRKRTEEQNRQKELLADLEMELDHIKEQLRFMERRQDDFERFVKEYQNYLDNCNELETCRKQIRKFKERQALVKNRLEQLAGSLDLLRTELDQWERKSAGIQEKWIRYEKFTECSESELPNQEEARVMENRYAALTSELSAGLQELEEQEKRASVRYQKETDELERLCKKYHFSGNEWLEVSYNCKEEQQQEIQLENYRRKLEVKQRLVNEENTKLAVIEQQIADLMNRILKECGKESLLAEQEIRDTDFEERKSRLQYQQQEILSETRKLSGKLHSYNENLTALAEYSEFMVMMPVEWQEAFEEMSEKELRNFKGSLIRDYKSAVEARGVAKECLVRILNEIIRRDIFQDAFYRKPLESMLELSGAANLVLKQLDTTMQSYDSLMSKLDIDISIIEKEKNKIVELLEAYVQEVHQNLGMIDRNSTITIREKPVKMLKIQLPDWAEQENMYHIRIEDLIDDVTLKGVEIFEKNGNAQEYFGAKITTKNLYDTVVGIGNVQIRLYKIEEQREYPITWADVARNSGGEGFLSAFVILSSLLYYIRKDEADIFADRNEGKVLLMDNPFAQTNAAHLLKPLMDMAKKTNTQLICLTGLGGESIYSRFNNIYVLNLIAASLRSGMQYLKADHVCGSEPETMVLSQIEVMEQQSLIF